MAKFSEVQIAFVLEQAENESSSCEACCKVEISEAT